MLQTSDFTLLQKVLAEHALSAEQISVLHSGRFRSLVCSQQLVSYISEVLQRRYNIAPDLEWTALTLSCQLFQTKLAEEAQRIEDLSSRQGLGLQAIKGRWISGYLPGYVRDSGDLDYICAPDQIGQGVRALIAAGYQNYQPHFLSRYNRRVLHAVTLKSQQGFELDLHWRLAEKFILLKSPPIKSCQQIPPELHYFNLVIQAYKNNWSRLVNFLDLQKLSRTKQLDTALIAEYFGVSGSQRIYTQTMLLQTEFENSRLSPRAATPGLRELYTFSNDSAAALQKFTIRHLLPFGDDLKKHNFVFATAQKLGRNLF